MQTINECSRVGGRTMVLVLFLATLLAGCFDVTVDCGGGKAGGKDGTITEGCMASTLAQGSALPGGAIAINPTGGTIPPGAICNAISNTKCNEPGVRCSLNPAQRCRDTYNIGTTQCMCQCR